MRLKELSYHFPHSYKKQIATTFSIQFHLQESFSLSLYKVLSTYHPRIDLDHLALLFLNFSKAMSRSRGIKLGRKLVRLFKWCIRRRTRRATPAYRQLQPPAGPVSKLCKWISSFGCQAKRSLLCLGKLNPGYIRLGKDPIALPKGHLAVYVGEKEGSISRVVVPILYFNHPLFEMLLQKAEKVHGFDHPGGIQIPCPISELERVQMKIAAACGGGVGRSRRRLLDYPLDSFL